MKHKDKLRHLLPDLILHASVIFERSSAYLTDALPLKW